MSLQSCLTLCKSMDCRLLCPWDSPGKSTGVGCHFLLQGISHTRGSKPLLLGLLHWQAGYLLPAPLWIHLDMPSLDVYNECNHTIYGLWKLNFSQVCFSRSIYVALCISISFFFIASKYFIKWRREGKRRKMKGREDEERRSRQGEGGLCSCKRGNIRCGYRYRWVRKVTKIQECSPE